MRSFVIAAVAALAFATAASAAQPKPTPPGPYHMDSHHMCHAANGQYVANSLCQGSHRPVCQAGVSKPCGNTCIPLNKTCNVTTH